MEMGDYIRELRKQRELTQEELGKRLMPPVNRAAINNWEHGRVENIRRAHIEQMANIFGVNPVDLMCLGGITPISREEKMLSKYRMLSEYDKGKVAAYIEGLLDSPEYKKKANGVVS